MPDIQLPAVDIAVVAQLLIIFGWAVGLTVIDLFIPAGSKKTTGYLAIVGLVVAALAGVPLWGSDRTTLSGSIRLDNFGLTISWIVLAITIITILISLDYLARHGIERGEYYVLLLLATGGMLLLGQGNDLVVMFIGLELLSITLYVLVGFALPKIASEEAAMKYLLIGAFATGFLVFGIALVYGGTGSSNLATIAEYLSRATLVAEDHSYLLAGAALVVVGLGYKVSIAPFQMYTPDVYEGAPTPITAFMSVGSKAAALAALARFLMGALPTERAIWVPALAALAAITLLWGNIGALAQRNVKRMLAYSSIGQAGYLLMALLGNPGRASEALLFYLVSYALTNLAAFAVLIALEQRGEAAWDMQDLAGLAQRHPGLAAAMSIAMLSLAGVPLTAGFLGKVYVFSAAWDAGLAWLTVLAVVVSVIGAFYYLRIVVTMLLRDPSREMPSDSGRGVTLGMGIAAAAIVVFGIIPTPVINLVQQSVLALTK